MTPSKTKSKLTVKEYSASKYNQLRRSQAEVIAADCAAIEDAALLFRKGKDYYAAGDYEESYHCYRKSWDLRPSYDVAGNIGNLEVSHLKRYADGATHLRYALAHLPGSLDDERRAEVTARIRELLATALAHVCTLTLSVEPPAAEILVDGAPVGRAPLEREIYLEPGEHRLEARLPGHDDASATLLARAGTAERIELRLEPSDRGGQPIVSPAPAPEPPAPSGEREDPIVALSATGLGLGVAALVAGGVLVGLSFEPASERDDRLTAIGGGEGRQVCAVDPMPVECTAVDELDAERRTFVNAGIWLWIGGGALLAGTAVYHFWPREGGSGAALRLAPGGASLRGWF